MEISALVSSASNGVCLQTEVSPWCFGQTPVFCLCSSSHPALPSPAFLPDWTPPTPQPCFKPLPSSCRSSHLYIYLPSPPSKPYLPFRVMSPRSVLQERRSHFSGSLQQEGLHVALIVLLLLVYPACLYLIDVSICLVPPTASGKLPESKEYVSRVWLSKALNTVPCSPKVLINHWPMRIFNLLIWNHWFSPS